MTLTNRVQKYIKDNPDKTAKEVSDFFGCHVGFVRKVCERRGIATNPAKRGRKVGTKSKVAVLVDRSWDYILVEPYARRKENRIKRTLEVRPVSCPIYGRGAGYMTFSILSL